MVCLGILSLFASCAPQRTYYVSETVEPVVVEEVIVVRRPTRVYEFESSREYLFVERPFCLRHRFYSRRHCHPMFHTPRRCYPGRSEVHFGIGFQSGF